MLDWLPENVSTFGGAVDALFQQIYYLTLVVLILVLGILLYFVCAYRRRNGRTAEYSHGNKFGIYMTWCCQMVIPGY